MPKDKEETVEEDDTYYPHLKRFIDLNLVADNTIYPDLENIHQFVKPYM